MNNKNYYDILGINKDASAKEIKSAFKKLSIKYHPDKQAGKSDEEKKVAEKKFKDINEAYQVLGDEEKKQHYDMFGTVDGSSMNSQGFNNSFGGFGFNPFGDDWFDPFGRTSNRRGPSGFTREAPITPGSDIRMQIPLTLEEVFNGCKKTVRYERKVRCASCHGEGGTGKKTCPHCHGTGRLVDVQNTPYGMIRQETLCKHCQGTGQIVEHTCKTCHGSGYTTIKETLEINIPAGIQHGNGLRILGKGNESKSKKGQNGNFIAIAIHNYDFDKYVVEEFNVIEHINLPYYDLLLGCEYEHTFPDGKKKKINIESCTPDGKVIRLYNEGISNKGDYYLTIHYNYPTKLTDNERTSLENIKVEKAKENISK